MRRLILSRFDARYDDKIRNNNNSLQFDWHSSFAQEVPSNQILGNNVVFNTLKNVCFG